MGLFLDADVRLERIVIFTSGWRASSLVSGSDGPTPQQLRDVGVAAGSMKFSDAIARAVGKTGRLEINPNHLTTSSDEAAEQLAARFQLFQLPYQQTFSRGLRRERFTDFLGVAKR